MLVQQSLWAIPNEHPQGCGPRDHHIPFIDLNVRGISAGVIVEYIPGSREVLNTYDREAFSSPI
jgi:hypothetical protein